MRKYRRYMARVRMRRAGLRQINKRPRIIGSGAPGRLSSFFARNWREWAVKPIRRA